MILVPLLLIFGGYIAFSILLFFFPTILHSYTFHKLLIFRQALSGKRVLRIAHRGGSMIATENTIQTFRINAGISDMLEMDVCQTKDGILVVHHDHDLQRTCGVKGKIKDFNYADLPPFKKRIQLNFVSDGRTIKTNGQKIPLLQDVFKQFPDISMNIELKTPSEAAVKEFSRLIKLYNRNDKTIVGIRGKQQRELRQLDINGLRFMNDSQLKKVLLYLITGLLPFIYIEETSLQIPLFTQQAYEWKIKEWGNSWKVRFTLKAIGVMNILLRPLVEHFRRRGIMTFYWVCNSEQSFKRAIQCGACGIMTDDPPLLNSYLQTVSLSPQVPQSIPSVEGKKQN